MVAAGLGIEDLSNPTALRKLFLFATCCSFLSATNNLILQGSSRSSKAMAKVLACVTLAITSLLQHDAGIPQDAFIVLRALSATIAYILLSQA